MERPLNIRHFAALAATVRHGSVTRAARAINLTQPALTQAIAGLEASLGVTLFERSAREQMGRHTLREHTLELVLSGQTTVTEAMSIVTSIAR